MLCYHTKNNIISIQHFFYRKSQTNTKTKSMIPGNFNFLLLVVSEFLEIKNCSVWICKILTQNNAFYKALSDQFSCYVEIVISLDFNFEKIALYLL